MTKSKINALPSPDARLTDTKGVGSRLKRIDNLVTFEQWDLHNPGKQPEDFGYKLERETTEDGLFGVWMANRGCTYEREIFQEEKKELEVDLLDRNVPVPTATSSQTLFSAHAKGFLEDTGAMCTPRNAVDGALPRASPAICAPPTELVQFATPQPRGIRFMA